MKKYFILFLFLCCTIPLTVCATEILNTKDSFQLARAVKLGRSSSESSMLSREFLPGTGGGTTFCPANCAQCDDDGTCTRCKSGLLLSGGQCVTCPTGYTCDGTETPNGCDSGYYSYNGSCKTCPAHYASCSGSTVTCQAGYYRTENNGYSCTLCEAGTYASGTGNTSCTNCPTGTYASGTGNTSCSSCSTIRISESIGTCSTCTILGICTSISCPEGYALDSSGNRCVQGCSKTADICATENGGTAADWRVEGTGSSCSCATDKKYVMLTDQHPNMKYSAEKYSRIKAVKDFGTIKAGTLGGYIEKEDNLSQTGNAWVGCDSTGCAVVSSNAKVYGNALVSGGGATDYNGKPDEGYGGATLVMNDAQVYGNAKVLHGSRIWAGKVYGNATFHGAEIYSAAPTKPTYPGYNVSQMSIAGEVYGDAHIYAGGYIGGSGSAGPNNNPKVYGNAILAGGDGDKVCMARVTYLGQVYENAKIFRCGEVSGGKVHGSAIVRNDLFGVSGNADVYGNAIVEGHCVVEGNAKMYGNAKCSPASSSSGVPYVCGNAVLSGTAQVIAATTGGKNSICKNSYSSGNVAWQESYCSSKNCPQ